MKPAEPERQVNAVLARINDLVSGSDIERDGRVLAEEACKTRDD